MWGFYERLQLFLWFPGSLESTWTDFIICNDDIADHLEYSLPSWGHWLVGVCPGWECVYFQSVLCLCALVWQQFGSRFSWLCLCVTTPRLWFQFLLTASMSSLTFVVACGGSVESLSAETCCVSSLSCRRLMITHRSSHSSQRSLVVQDPQVTAEQYVVYDFSMTVRISTL